MKEEKKIDLRNIKVEDIEKKIEEHDNKIRETMGEYGHGRDFIEGDLGAKSGYKTVLGMISLKESLMSDNDDWIMLVLNNEIKQCDIFLEAACSCGVSYQIQNFGERKKVYEVIRNSILVEKEDKAIDKSTDMALQRYGRGFKKWICKGGIKLGVNKKE